MHGHVEHGHVIVKGLKVATHKPFEIRTGIAVDCPYGEHTVKIDFVGAGKGTREYRPTWDADGKLTVEGLVESPCGRLFRITADSVEHHPPMDAA